MLDRMGYIPLFFDVTARPCVVLGGDEFAERRVRTLLEAGAIVTVISAALTPGLAELAANGHIRHVARSFGAGDLDGATLAYYYAEDLGGARVAVDEARALGVPINVADRPALCSFIAPAVVKRGALQIAISTGGASPSLAKTLRHELEISFGPEYAELVAILAGVRQIMRAREPEPWQRAELARNLTHELRAALNTGERQAVDETLRRNLGITLAELKLDQSEGAPGPVSQLGPANVR